MTLVAVVVRSVGIRGGRGPVAIAFGSRSRSGGGAGGGDGRRRSGSCNGSLLRGVSGNPPSAASVAPAIGAQRHTAKSGMCSVGDRTRS